MSDEATVWADYHESEIAKREKEIERLKEEAARQWVQGRQEGRAEALMDVQEALARRCSREQKLFIIRGIVTRALARAEVPR